jgi:hypothetical protein
MDFSTYQNPRLTAYLTACDQDYGLAGTYIEVGAVTLRSNQCRIIVQVNFFQNIASLPLTV